MNSGAIDLVNDLVTVYKHYCKGRLTWNMEPLAEQSSDLLSVELFAYPDGIAHKDILSSIDCCIEYFTKLILGLSSYEKEKKTGKIDQLCTLFLPVLFEGANINNDNVTSLLTEIEKHQTEQHFYITKKRYEAIIEYYCGNQESCIEKLNEALHKAKQSNLPEWLINDILIDLRNQDTFLEESRNKIYPFSEYQKELDNCKTLLYYPLLDRLNSNYFEGIIDEAIKHKIEALGTVTFGHGLGTHIKSLAGIYVLAMYHGSLSHIQLLYRRIKSIAFYSATKYSNWSIRKLLLKVTIIDGRQKEIDGIIRNFSDLHSKMNEKDASEIYAFANNKSIQHQRIICKLEAFRIVNYYMSDENFNIVWVELFTFIDQWIEDKDSITIVGSSIFAALEESYLRIAQDQLIEIIYKCLRSNKRRYFDEVFKLIRKCVSLDNASPENVAALLEAIINIVRNPDERTQIHSLEAALFTLRKKNRVLTEELDNVIAKEMPTFYNGTYRLETSIEEDADMPTFLESYIAQVCSDNDNQGKNGQYFGRGNQPHITIKNILVNSDIEFSEHLVDSAFKAACGTLLKDSQTIEAKMDAIELLVFLIKSQLNTKERNKYEVERILSNTQKVETAHSIMTNLSEINLHLSSLLLYNCLGENIIVGLLEALADIGDDVESNLNASEAMLNYLEANNDPISDIQLERIFLQRAIEWSVEPTLDIRWNAVRILFSLLRNRENKNVICNQLVKLMDNDNVYIKNSILRKIYLIEEIDIATYRYIIQKGTVDTNYVVRLVANEVQHSA